MTPSDPRSADGAPRPKAFLVTAMNIEAEHEDEFNRWYSQDHMPSLLRCPGFIRGRRLSASPMILPQGVTMTTARFGRRYVMLYDLESIDALDTIEYKTIAFIDPTEWTKRMRLHLRDVVRDIFLEMTPEPVTMTPSRLTTLKPLSVNVTSYVPGGSDVKRYWPEPSVATARVFSMSTGLAASTVTPGRIAPEVSWTTPASVACA